MFKTYLEDDFKTSWRPKKMFFGSNPFIWSCRLTVYRFQSTLPEMNFLNTFLKGVLKISENVQEEVWWSYFSVNCSPINHNLQSYVFSSFKKIPERTSAVKFLFTEAGTTGSLQNKRILENSHESMQVYLERTLPWMFYRQVYTSFCSS